MAKSEYKDLFTEEFPSMEAIREKYGAVIWCRFKDCKSNVKPKGLLRTTGSVKRLRGYTPLSPTEDVWKGLCARGEIAIDYKEIRTQGGMLQKVPQCFVAAEGATGHLDMSRFLNPQMEVVKPPPSPDSAYGMGSDISGPSSKASSKKSNTPSKKSKTKK